MLRNKRCFAAVGETITPKKEMNDKTIKKVNREHSPIGTMSQKYLVAGKSMAMRLWQQPAAPVDPQPVRRDYETLGYKIEGNAELELGGQMIVLESGDS